MSPVLHANWDKLQRQPRFPQDVPSSMVDLEMALDLLCYPKEVGKHPADGMPVVVDSGRFGPMVKHGDLLASVPKVRISKATASVPPPRPAAGRATGQEAASAGF
jgi:topoisomerase IA-like protein